MWCSWFTNLADISKDLAQIEKELTHSNITTT
jgi:hypothetical protein